MLCNSRHLDVLFRYSDDFDKLCRYALAMRCPKLRCVTPLPGDHTLEAAEAAVSEVASKEVRSQPSAVRYGPMRVLCDAQYGLGTHMLLLCDVRRGMQSPLCRPMCMLCDVRLLTARIARIALPGG